MAKPFNFVIKMVRGEGAFTYINPDHIIRIEMLKLPEPYLKLIMSDGSEMEFKHGDATALIKRIEHDEGLISE